MIFQVQLIALLAGFLAAVLLTPLMRQLAVRFEIIDKPDARRKLHTDAIALCGGPVLLLAVSVPAIAAVLTLPALRSSMMNDLWPLLGFVAGCVGIVALGLADDRFHLRGRQKLAGQIAVSAIMVTAGFQIHEISLFGQEFSLYHLAIPASIVWLLLTINSINLIDGADGLCCSVGWIASACFAAMASYHGHWVEAMFASAIAGSLLGFLVFNFPPAKVFLGDSGSMLVGLILGALSLRTMLKSPTALSLLGVLAILALPLFDSSMAVLRRKLTGRSIFSTDRGHLHHSLITRGFGQSRLVILISIFSGVLAAGALVSVILRNEWIALMAVTLILGSLIAGRLFGHAEMRLLVSRVLATHRTLLSQRQTADLAQHHRLQGERSWERVWDMLVEFADKYDLAKVCLDLNAPWLHEGYHACWNRDKIPGEDQRWRIAVPLLVDDRSIGRLEVIGSSAAASSLLALDAFAILTMSVQNEIAMIIASETIEGVAAEVSAIDDVSVREPVMA